MTNKSKLLKILLSSSLLVSSVSFESEAGKRRPRQGEQFKGKGGTKKDNVAVVKPDSLPANNDASLFSSFTGWFSSKVPSLSLPESPFKKFWGANETKEKEGSQRSSFEIEQERGREGFAVLEQLQEVPDVGGEVLTKKARLKLLMNKEVDFTKDEQEEVKRLQKELESLTRGALFSPSKSQQIISEIEKDEEDSKQRLLDKNKEIREEAEKKAKEMAKARRQEKKQAKAASQQREQARIASEQKILEEQQRLAQERLALLDRAKKDTEAKKERIEELRSYYSTVKSTMPELEERRFFIDLIKTADLLPTTINEDQNQKGLILTLKKEFDENASTQSIKRLLDPVALEKAREKIVRIKENELTQMHDVFDKDMEELEKLISQGKKTKKTLRSQLKLQTKNEMKVLKTEFKELIGKEVSDTESKEELKGLKLEKKETGRALRIQFAKLGRKEVSDIESKEELEKLISQGEEANPGLKSELKKLIGKEVSDIESKEELKEAEKLLEVKTTKLSKNEEKLKELILGKIKSVETLALELEELTGKKEYIEKHRLKQTELEKLSQNNPNVEESDGEESDVEWSDEEESDGEGTDVEESDGEGTDVGIRGNKNHYSEGTVLQEKGNNNEGSPQRVEEFFGGVDDYFKDEGELDQVLVRNMEIQKLKTTLEAYKKGLSELDPNDEEKRAEVLKMIELYKNRLKELGCEEDSPESPEASGKEQVSKDEQGSQGGQTSTDLEEEQAKLNSIETYEKEREERAQMQQAIAASLEQEKIDAKIRAEKEEQAAQEAIKQVAEMVKAQEQQKTTDTVQEASSAVQEAGTVTVEILANVSAASNAVGGIVEARAAEQLNNLDSGNMPSEMQGNMSGEVPEVGGAPLSGTSSGSESGREVSVWVKGFMGRATQKAISGKHAFKANQNGGVIGLDTKFNDFNVVGLALSHANVNVKFKDATKAEVSANMLTAYWSAYLSDKLFFNSQVKFGKINADTKGNKLDVKMTGNMFGIREEVGYQIRMTDSSFAIPTISISYDKTNIKSSKEKVQNLGLSGTNSHRLSAGAGVTLMKIMDLGESKLIPELSLGVDKALNVKNGAIKISSDNESLDSLSIKGKKDTRMSFIAGTGLKLITINHLEMGVNYQLLKRKGFLSHTGSLRFKVKF